MPLGLPGADTSAVGTINRPLRRVVPVRDIPDIWLKFIIGLRPDVCKMAPVARRGRFTAPTADYEV